MIIAGVEVNTSSMSIEELQKTRDELRQGLYHVDHQLTLIKMSMRKHRSDTSKKE